MTSVEIKVFVTLAALGAVYTFVRDIQHTMRKQRLIKRVRDRYPREWGALQWGRRTLFPAAAPLRLHRSGAIPHPYFAREYSLVGRWAPDMAIAFAVACASIALAIVGGLYWGWR